MSVAKLSTIELYKENMKFSAGHFTIFSATKREKMHGHNYTVYVALTVIVREQGLNFDYRFYKDKIYTLCRSLNEAFLLAGQSEFLTIQEQAQQYEVVFNQEKMFFPKTDLVILPIKNVTVEELSRWFLQQLIADQQELNHNAIQSVVVKVASAPGQSGSATWERGHGE